MGTYVELLKADEAIIRDDRKEEFENRVEQLFRLGGKMQDLIETIAMCLAIRLVGNIFIKLL